MDLSTLLIEEVSEHNEISYNSKFYLGNPDQLPRIDQPQAVCFVANGDQFDVVLYRHIKGFTGCPGGGTEADETVEQTLAREIHEEINAELIKFGGYAFGIIHALDQPSNLTYHGRYWAIVKLSDGPVQDPAGKSLERIVVPLDKAAETLGWGEKGRLFIANAYAALQQQQT